MSRTELKIFARYNKTHSLNILIYAVNYSRFAWIPSAGSEWFVPYMIWLNSTDSEFLLEFLEFLLVISYS